VAGTLLYLNDECNWMSITNSQFSAAAGAGMRGRRRRPSWYCCCDAEMSDARVAAPAWLFGEGRGVKPMGTSRRDCSPSYSILTADNRHSKHYQVN